MKTSNQIIILVKLQILEILLILIGNSLNPVFIDYPSLNGCKLKIKYRSHKKMVVIFSYLFIGMFLSINFLFLEIL